MSEEVTITKAQAWEWIKYAIGGVMSIICFFLLREIQRMNDINERLIQVLVVQAKHEQRLDGHDKELSELNECCKGSNGRNGEPYRQAPTQETPILVFPNADNREEFIERQKRTQ